MIASQLATCRVCSDQVRIRVTDDLLIATVSGVLGLPECLGLLRRVRSAAKDAEVLGVILDIRCAALTLSLEEYVEVGRAAIAEPISTDVAYLAGAWVRSVFEAHQNIMMRRGLKRRVFSCEAKARRWLTSAASGTQRKDSAR